jgi:hypothetical protein
MILKSLRMKKREIYNEFLRKKRLICCIILAKSENRLVAILIQLVYEIGIIRKEYFSNERIRTCPDQQ